MELPHIPQDDLMDVLEMMTKIEESITTVFKDNDLNLAMSALMSASIDSLIAHCSTLEEIVFYRNLFVQMLDSSIRSIKVKGPEKPSS